MQPKIRLWAGNMFFKDNEAAASGCVGVPGTYSAESNKADYITALNAAVDTAPTSAPADVATADLLQLLAKSRISADEVIEPDEFLFSWQGVDFLPRQNLISIKAPAKSGKTFALTAFVLAFLKGDYCGLRSYAATTDKVLFVDTEQSRNDSRKLLRRITEKASDQMERVIVLNVRNLSSTTRLQLIDLEMQMSRPALVVIDGIADLIEGMDYNDLVQAEGKITELSRIAEQYNAVVATAIHTNNKDDFATGWLGKLLRHKCAMELAVNHKDETASTRTIEATAVRHRRIEPITIDIQDTDDTLGEVVIVDPGQADAVKKEKRRNEYRTKLMELGIEPPLTILRAELLKRVQDAKTQIEAKPCRRQAANNLINRCIEAGALRVDGERVIFDQYSEL